MKDSKFYISARIVKVLSSVLFLCYFITMIAGPSHAYTIKGEDNGVSYEIYMHQWREYGVEVMEKNRLYYLEVLAYKNDYKINNLSITLPNNFNLMKSYVQTALITGTEGKSIFVVESPNKVGNYELIFSGEDKGNNEINLSVPIKVVEKGPSQFESMYGKDAGNFILTMGIIATVILVLGISGIIR